MSNDELSGIDFTVDKKNLYREEGLTDLKVASIRQLKPIQEDGSDDPSRSVIYLGTTQLMTPEGPFPIQARLMANNLQEALDVFPSAMKEALERAVEEAEKMRREHESRIVVPGRE